MINRHDQTRGRCPPEPVCRVENVVIRRQSLFVQIWFCVSLTLLMSNVTWKVQFPDLVLPSLYLSRPYHLRHPLRCLSMRMSLVSSVTCLGVSRPTSSRDDGAFRGKLNYGRLNFSRGVRVWVTPVEIILVLFLSSGSVYLVLFTVIYS